MNKIFQALISSAVLFLVCFVVMLMIGLDVPNTLRLTSVIAAVFFAASTLSSSKSNNLAQQPVPRHSTAAKVAGGLGAGVVAGVALASLTGDDEDSSFLTESRAPFRDDSVGVVDHPSINPANGLPMVGSVDVMGNPFGTDLSDTHDSFSMGADSFESFDGFRNSNF